MQKLPLNPETLLESLSTISAQVTALLNLVQESQSNKNDHDSKNNNQSPDYGKIQKDFLSLFDKKLHGELVQKSDRNIERAVELKREKLSSEVKKVQQEVFKIAFSGGPCAGKTTAITKLSELLREKGYVVFTVPEAATMIFQSGGTLNLAEYNDEMKMRFQFFLMMMQMSLEDCLLGISRNGEKEANVVLLCDRGTMDGSAYIEKALWEQVLSEYDLNVQRIRDQRYDLVIHITSAANGAEEFFSDKTNAARSETMEFARHIDRRLEEAWIDHPHFVQINNKFVSFEQKIDSVINTVYKYLGIETGIDFYNKYLVANPFNKLAALFEDIPDIKLHTYNITDIVFFKDDSKKELTYFRKRVN